MALSLYNKYRPQTFKDVVGQVHVEKTLANAVEKNKVSHAYLFCGPRGTGKTTTARILAKALLCDKAPTPAPDGTCEQCKEISDGVHPDVYELDAASRTGVDNVREEIIGRVNFAPTHGKYKVYIIDEVHMLSTAAFNALLKTLEEPPEHVIFMLCTTDVHKVPDTVQARCQRFDFKHLAIDEIIGRLQYICEREGFDHESAALELIAQRSRGGMRDAISSLEQVSVFNAGSISYNAVESLLGMVDADLLFALCDNLANHDAAACFDWVAGYVQGGSDIAILVNDLATHVRNLYAVQATDATDEHLVHALEIEAIALPRLREQASKLGPPERLAWMLTTIGSLSAELKNAANARLALEVALVRMLRPESEQSLEALTVRVAMLEEIIARGGGPAPPAPLEASSQHAGAKDGALEMEAAMSGASVSTASSSQWQGSDQAPGSSQAPGSDQAFDSDLAPGSPQAQYGNHEQTTVQAQGTSDGEASSQQPQPSATSQLSATNQALYRQWNGVVDAIKNKKPGVAASLNGIAPRLSKDGKHLTLELPGSAATSKLYLETETNRELLHNTVEKVFGEALAVTITVAVEPVSEKAPASTLESAPEPVFESAPESAPGFDAAPAPAPAPALEPAPESLFAPGTAPESAPDTAPVPVPELSFEPPLEPDPAPGTSPAPEPAPTPQQEAEPSKEELDHILSISLGNQAQFEEQQPPDIRDEE